MTEPHPVVPRWQKIAYLIIGVIALALLVYLTQLSRHGFAQQSTQVAQSDRRDCVTTLSTARRSVFDDVDIYKAILIQAATDKALYGVTYTPEELDHYKTIDRKMHAALKEARRLQPSATLDRLIAHGGTIAGKHYKACTEVG